MSERFDAVVIGGGVSGFGAAALLAKSGLRTLLLERAATPSVEPALRALDPRLVKALKLARHGLTFAERDLTLAIPRAGGQPAVISRDHHVTARSIAALSPADAMAFAAYRREVNALARALRPAWWDGGFVAEIAAQLKPAQQNLLARLEATSASAFLSAWFESDALKAALAFDATACGFAPSEPGSALALLWGAAQEMSGLQGAVAIPQGGVGAVVQALSQAAQAAGAEIRTGAIVSRLNLADNAVAGLELAAGEQIDTSLVLSTLGRRYTLEKLAPTAAIGLGAARALARIGTEIGSVTLLFTLPPGLRGIPPDRRIVIAERLETFEAAHSAARLGQMPQEPVLELIAPPAVEPDMRLAFVRVWPVPMADTFDGDALAQTVCAMLERHIPGFAATRCDVQPPRPAAPSLARLLASAAARIETPVHGLLLCGDDAEPADAICGRAARQAAHLARARHRKRGAA